MAAVLQSRCFQGMVHPWKPCFGFTHLSHHVPWVTVLFQLGSGKLSLDHELHQKFSIIFFFSFLRFLSAFCLSGLTSRTKKQFFKLLRKMPFVGAMVSISTSAYRVIPAPCFSSAGEYTVLCIFVVISLILMTQDIGLECFLLPPGLMSHFYLIFLS